MMNNTIVIHIGSQLIGFWSSFAILLCKRFNVVIVCNRTAGKIVRGLIDGHSITIETAKDYYVQRGPLRPDLINQVRIREKKYGQTFAMLLSHQRGMGKGYIINVDHVPDPHNTRWSYEEKINTILNEFLFWEHIIEKHRPKLILSMLKTKILTTIASSYEVLYLALNYAKFGERLFWIENEYFTNYKMFRLIDEYVKEVGLSESFSDINYEWIASSKYTQSRLNHTYLFAVRTVVLRIFQELRHQLARFAFSKIMRRYHPKYPYPFLSWLPVHFFDPYNFRYMEDVGKTLNDLSRLQYVYLPLHMEPEVALMQFSPEFTNSLEMITWISKSLPVNWFIVVKEAPGCFGHRSRRFYEKMLKIPNVVLAHPSISPWEWIKNSALVATITGTTGVEAVYFEKPVLSYGKHQIVNRLPTVRYASNYDTTKEAVDELLSISPDDTLFKVSKEALYRAQIEVSFEMPGLIKCYKSRELHMDLAEIAQDNLFKQYSEIIQ